VDGEASGEDRGDVGYIEYQEREQEQGIEHVAGSETIPQHKRRRVTWQDLKERMVQGVGIMWSFLLYTSYVPAIICMMLWSVFYPSWPALVLLLWACVIWLIPKMTPRNSLLYSSPLLIFYSVCLLMLQYVYSLDLTLSELSPVDGLGQECFNTSTTGCKSFVPLLKVHIQSICVFVYTLITMQIH
jgi:hypothetical protein